MQLLVFLMGLGFFSDIQSGYVVISAWFYLVGAPGTPISETMQEGRIPQRAPRRGCL